MGSRLVKMEFTPGENEQIEAVIKVPEEPRSIIHGIVKDTCDKIIENAVVKLFELEDPHHPNHLRPITHAFTDECGQFLFGPLAPGRHYVIKVWVNDVKVRHLVIHPDNDGYERLEVGEGENIVNVKNREDENTKLPSPPRNQAASRNPASNNYRPPSRGPRQPI